MAKVIRDVKMRHPKTKNEILVTKAQAEIHKESGWEVVAEGEKATAEPTDIKTKRES